MKFETAGPTEVVFELFDSNGGRVAFTSRQQSDNGLHVLRFNTSALPTGTYFFTMRHSGTLHNGSVKIVR